MNMTWQQGMMPPAPQPLQSPSLMNYQPGQWSQMAYQMAGQPHQGGMMPQASVPGLVPGSIPSGGGGMGSVGGTALGVLGALAKNPQLVKSAYNGISGLLGGGGASGAGAAAAAPTASAAAPAAAGGSAPGATAYGYEASQLPSAGSAALSSGANLGEPALAHVGTGAVNSAADSAFGSASDALGGAGLLGGAPEAAGLLSSTAPAAGGFATGGAAGADMVGGGLASGSSVLGAVALPVAAYAAYQLGDSLYTGKEQQAAHTMNSWANSVGAKPLDQSGAKGQGSFGLGRTSSGSIATPQSSYRMPNGQVMTQGQVSQLIAQYAKQHGLYWNGH